MTKTKCLFVPESIHNGAKMIILMGNKNKNYSEIIPLPPKGNITNIPDPMKCPGNLGNDHKRETGESFRPSFLFSPLPPLSGACDRNSDQETQLGGGSRRK